MNNLRKCSRCHSEILEKYFSVSRKGQLYKTCDNCRKKTNCEHNREKPLCKECNDPVDVRIKAMIKGAKIIDKKNNNYDEENTITEPFVKDLFTHNIRKNGLLKCYRCNRKLQCVVAMRSYISLERKNQDVGHTQDNCIIACFTCNTRPKHRLPYLSPLSVHEINFDTTNTEPSQSI